jgi:hypothetical protein
VVIAYLEKGLRNICANNVTVKQTAQSQWSKKEYEIQKPLQRHLQPQEGMMVVGATMWVKELLYVPNWLANFFRTLTWSM